MLSAADPEKEGDAVKLISVTTSFTQMCQDIVYLNAGLCQDIVYPFGCYPL